MPYEYDPQPYVDGEVFTFAGPVPRLATTLTDADSRGGLRVRLGVRRSHYRVKPGLYAIGDPDDTAPVLVTGNYKLTVDVVRAALAGRDVWLLVIDSKGVNVWCSAGKGVFSTAEVVSKVREVRLEQVVSHTRLVLPQLGATGVAAHEVRAQTGFSVVWGPVRVDDIGAFIDAGFRATPEMRRVTFPVSERAKLVGVELSVLWKPVWLAVGSAALALTAALMAFAPAYAAPVALLLTAAVLAVAAGAALTPILLPWVPGRAFALKGALVGGLLLSALVVGVLGIAAPAWAWGIAAAGTALASFVAMNFTGSSTFTSPSGVEWEMRRAIPVQAVLAVMGVGLYALGLLGIRG